MERSNQIMVTIPPKAIPIKCVMIDFFHLFKIIKIEKEVAVKVLPETIFLIIP